MMATDAPPRAWTGRGMIWTRAMEDDLRARFADGESYGEIGRAMGVSRNAALGKSHRLGLERHAPSAVAAPARAAPVAEPAPPPKPPRAPPVKSDLSRTTTSAVTSLRAYAPGRARDPAMRQPVPPGHPAFAPLPGVAPVSLDALGGHRCCWPVGDASGEAQLYCAAPADLPPQGTKRSPYCPHRLATRQTASTPRRRTAA